MYQEEPEISAGAIRYIKVASLISVIVMSFNYFNTYAKLEVILQRTSLSLYSSKVSG